MTKIASVSAIIPCYRCARTIGRAVESVARQTVRPLELIIIDDASGDDTLAELRRLQERHGAAWLKIVSLRQNVGAGSARNAGWEQARGDYVAFLDADDAWHPEKIAAQYAFMRAHPDAALSGHGHKQLEDGEAIDRPTGRPGHRRISRRELLISNRFITPSAMVRRDVPQRFREGKRFMEDHLLWLEIVSSGAPVYRLAEELAFIYKAPFGESGLSSRTLEMELGELANFWQLRTRGHLGFAGALGLNAWSLAKYLRRIAVVHLRTLAGPMTSIFPIAYMSVVYAITALLIAFGLLGKTELAADIAVAQGATLATFYAFSANTRNLILGQSRLITAADILFSRLLLVGPLALLAFALAAYGGRVSEPIAAAIVLRRAVEWLTEVQLCEKEVARDRRFAVLFLLGQGVLFVLAIVTSVAGPQYAVTAFFTWALAPLAASLPYIVRTQYPSIRRFVRLLPAMLPHFGSTAMQGISIYAFRVVILLLIAKSDAGDLFTAIAIGSFLGSMFANVFGPSLMLHEARTGRRRFPSLLSGLLVFTAAAGASIFWAAAGDGAVLAQSGKSLFFWRATGLALVAGVIMVFAQRVRLQLLHEHAGVDVFGPDVLAQILLVAAVPIAYALAGLEGMIALYPANALLAYAFYRSAEMHTLRSLRRGELTRRSDVLLTTIAFLLFLPLFFTLSGEIYNPAEPMIDSGGILRNLPIPISVIACYGGILILGNYRRAALPTGIIFLLFGLMLTAALVTTSGEFASERAKLLLTLQFILPMFALVLGNVFAAAPGSDRALYRGIVAVLLSIVPLQLVLSWAHGTVVLGHSLFVFAVYQHFQYVPLMLVSGYLVAIYALWDSGTLRKPLLLLGPLITIYAVASFSMLGLFTALAGLGTFAAIRLRRRRDVVPCVLLAVCLVAAGGYFYSSRNTAEFAEKFPGAARADRPPEVAYISDIVSLSGGDWIVDGEPKLLLGYLIAYRPKRIAEGDAFIVEGELFEGGLSVGVVTKGAFYQNIAVTAPGPFAVTLRPPPGTYKGVLANQLFDKRRNHARITRMGWSSTDKANLEQAGKKSGAASIRDSARLPVDSATDRPSAEPYAIVAGESDARPEPAHTGTSPPLTSGNAASTASARTGGSDIDPTAFHARRGTPPHPALAFLPKNLLERMSDWHLYASRIGESWTTLLLGHPRPLDREILTSPHNYYLDFLYNFGVLPFLPLVGLVGVTLYGVWRWRREILRSEPLLGLSCVVLFLILVDNNFKVTLRQPYPGIVTFFLWGVLLARLKRFAGDPQPLR